MFAKPGSALSASVIFCARSFAVVLWPPANTAEEVASVARAAIVVILIIIASNFD
jgi:hypothetical protein